MNSYSEIFKEDLIFNENKKYNFNQDLMDSICNLKKVIWSHGILKDRDDIHLLKAELNLLCKIVIDYENGESIGKHKFDCLNKK